MEKKRDTDMKEEEKKQATPPQGTPTKAPAAAKGPAIETTPAEAEALWRRPLEEETTPRWRRRPLQQEETERICWMCGCVKRPQDFELIRGGPTRRRVCRACRYAYQIRPAKLRAIIRASDHRRQQHEAKSRQHDETSEAKGGQRGETSEARPQPKDGEAADRR